MDMPTKKMKIAVLSYPAIFCAFSFLLVFLAGNIVTAIDFSPAITNLGVHLAIIIFGYLALRLFFYKRNKQFYSYLLSILILGALFSVFYSHTILIAAAVS